MTLREQLIRDEGNTPVGVPDAHGSFVIGVGHNVRFGPPISHQIRMQILDDDIRYFHSELIRRLPWVFKLSMARLAVLVGMAFNQGVAGLIQNNPKMLAAAAANDFEIAAKELLDGPLKDEVGDRAIRWALQLKTGEWQ